jgi:RNA polymerase sigma-70 factor (family 1)
MPESQRQRFTRLFLEHSATLASKMRRILTSSADAEDIVQEAFLRAYEHVDELRVPGAFVYSAARNLALDRRRQEKTARDSAPAMAALALVESSTEAPETRLLAEERTRLLKEAIERLPRQCRTVFVLKILQGHSYKEISATLGISIKTIENHMTRALREVHWTLRRRYAEKENQHD